MTRSCRTAAARPRFALGVWTSDESGAVLVEYALVLSLLSLAFIGGMDLIEKATFQALSNVGTELIDYGLRNGQ